MSSPLNPTHDDASMLRSVDFPLATAEEAGEHPKFKQLQSLVQVNSEEFNLQGQINDTRIYNGRPLRTQDQIAQSIAEAVKPEEGGHIKQAKSKSEKGLHWFVSNLSHDLIVIVKDHFFEFARSQNRRVTFKDVLCGRGNHSVNHEGNKVLRERCRRVFVEYTGSRGNAMKREIQERIYGEITSEGGRFLEVDNSIPDSEWKIFPRKLALGKIRQCIKDIEKIARRRRLNSDSASVSSAATTWSDATFASLAGSATTGGTCSSTPVGPKVTLDCSNMVRSEQQSQFCKAYQSQRSTMTATDLSGASASSSLITGSCRDDAAGPEASQCLPSSEHPSSTFARTHQNQRSTFISNETSWTSASSSLVTHYRDDLTIASESSGFTRNSSFASLASCLEVPEPDTSPSTAHSVPPQVSIAAYDTTMDDSEMAECQDFESLPLEMQFATVTIKRRTGRPQSETDLLREPILSYNKYSSRSFVETIENHSHDDSPSNVAVKDDRPGGHYTGRNRPSAPSVDDDVIGLVLSIDLHCDPDSSVSSGSSGHGNAAGSGYFNTDFLEFLDKNFEQQSKSYNEQNIFDSGFFDPPKLDGSDSDLE